jgi:predicted SAM-dependent methyltransferase
MKINLGCGRTIYDDWFNVDVARSPLAKRDPDLFSDIRKLPAIADDCAEVVMAIHVLEHIERWEVEETLVEWRRILKPGGTLILEMPDLFKCCRNILTGREGNKPEQLGMWGLFGDWTHHDPLMMHKWAWSYRTLAPVLTAAGFVSLREEETMFHQVGKGVRDFRVTAKK